MGLNMGLPRKKRSTILFPRKTTIVDNFGVYSIPYMFGLTPKWLVILVSKLPSFVGEQC